MCQINSNMTIFAGQINSKNMGRYILMLLIALSVVGCGGQKGSLSGAYDTLYMPRYASHFVVLRSGDTTILRVNNPWQGAKEVSYDYPFTEATIPQRIITMSTSHSAFVEALGKGSSIVGISSPQYISSEALRHLPDVGYNGNFHYETIAGLSSDLFTVYELSGENSSSISKIVSLSVPVVYIADYLESSPLAKAEWVVAFGAMLGNLDSAVEIFDGVQSNYMKVKQSVENRLKEYGVKRPSVMLNSPYKDVWYLPGDSTYMVRLIEDAGANYVAKGVGDNVTRAIAMEMAYTYLTKADIWLNPSSTVSSRSELLSVNPLLEDIDIPIYTNIKRTGKFGGSDYWESGVLRCDVILSDMVQIFYRESGEDIDSLLYYHREMK